ncbi:hypothetical protein [Pseudonocardia endophytica]|uniref:Uncharacterized protein n=1 Tax=Pseudonocardia endophytica TaxID=401976 RepID=A0A4R1HJG5_PSEEN|nr:hypothetical protein [Pseudonocardia endophytica]TCK21998.1 hypothetical protein EV378_5995 [Pseudonocardia endophytica]
MKPSTGTRLGSTACATEVIVVRAPSDDVDLTCGHAPMAPLPAETTTAIGEDGPGSEVGKRYVHPDSGMELLCTKAGAGRLRIGEAELDLKAAKRLPSSD